MKGKKTVLLCILDGWGIGNDEDPNNAIAKANIVNYKNILERYPFSKLETSGLAVGLPDGQIGNSEVGHMTIGAGRVIFQDLVRINIAIKESELIKNAILNDSIRSLKENSKSLHLMGLLSDGGVHSHISHMIFLANLYAENGVKVYLHLFLDGRDVAQKSAINFYETFKKSTNNNKNIILATVAGRYYAMDRDNKWDRVFQAYKAIVNAKSSYEKSFESFEELLNFCYENKVTDEFVKPCVFRDYKGFDDGDALLFANFRADRARQISLAILDPEFKEFEVKKIKLSSSIALTHYSDYLSKFYNILFPPIAINNSLPELLSKNKLSQLRIAETEKYAHVTFFFSCGKENEFENEKRILVKSPNVATYDLKPEMSSVEVGKNLVDAIESKDFDFIVVNYANPDMVGHSGDINAAIKACQAIDIQLKQLYDVILKNDGVMLISADHGNIECMSDGLGNPHTAHTTNLVPFIMVCNDYEKISLRNGSLKDIAPTILDIFDIEIPNDMTGKSLLVKK